MSERIFVTPTISGVRAFGWQLDYRPDGWLPLSIRTGRREWHVLRLPWGACVTLGRLSVISTGGKP